MIIRETHIVPKGIHAIRLQDYAYQVFQSIPTKKGMKKAIKRGEMRVNGQVAGTGHWVQAGQCIDLLDLEQHPPKAYPLDLEILYQDDYLAIIYKPAGIVVSGNQYRTIQNALVHNFSPSPLVDALKWVRPVHRLDAPTKGLLVVAKTVSALSTLGQLFAQRKVQKYYHAVVIGKLPSSSGRFTQAIDGLTAFTDYEVLEVMPSIKNQFLSLVQLSPHTGRTHQLRIHLAQAGCPILGDSLYGQEGMILKGKGLFLAAVRLKFRHPITQQNLDISIETPRKFGVFMKREARNHSEHKA